jgi:hypothetical protein
VVDANRKRIWERSLKGRSVDVAVSVVQAVQTLGSLKSVKIDEGGNSLADYGLRLGLRFLLNSLRDARCQLVVSHAVGIFPVYNPRRSSEISPTLASELGGLCALSTSLKTGLARVNSPDREFHLVLCRTISAFSLETLH